MFVSAILAHVQGWWSAASQTSRDAEVAEGEFTQARLLEENQRALREALREVLGGASCTPLPLPLLNLIADYGRDLPWKLATAAPGLFGPIETSGSTAQHYGAAEAAAAFIQGDTPLSYGRHAWRVHVGRSGGLLLGIAPAGKALDGHCMYDPSFYGVEAALDGGGDCYRAAGRAARGSGLERIHSGDTVDFLLDVDAGKFTAITLKDGRRCVLNVPAKRAWVPHFCFDYSGTSLSVEVLHPERAGKR